MSTSSGGFVPIRHSTPNARPSTRISAGERLEANWTRCKPRPRENLALVLLLDQLPRNIHRGRPEAFAADEKARAVARGAIERGLDRELPKLRRLFLYLPFEHSESLTDQDLEHRA